MKKKLLRLFLFLAIPNIALALCSNTGTTLVYVNGITTSYADAKSDLTELGKIIEQYGIENIYLKNGYNPTHLDGLGDDIESISQAFNTPISDYDLYTILTQIASEVTTRKVLLVGHSQGTFYTNEIYQYLVGNGIPTSSLGVYNIGTPASFVAGDGTYLTSTNDKVINTVRMLESETRVPVALPGNITIPEEPGYAEDMWGGHIPSVYLNGAPGRIATDIQKILTKLSSNGLDTTASCIEPPPLGFTYDIQNTTFGDADQAIADTEYAATDALNTVASVLDNTNDILHTAFSDVIFSVIPKPTAQNAAGAFAVEKALYGSSLSVADYDALVNGEDIPQVEPASPYEPMPGEDVSGAQSVESAPSQSIIEPIVIAQSTTTVLDATATAPVVQSSSPAPIAISPGFGGGSAPAATVASTITIPNPTPDIEATTSSAALSTSNSDSAASSASQTTSDTATSSTATSTPPVDTSQSTSTIVVIATTTPVAPAALAASPVIDNFDSGFTGWNNSASGWSTAAWSTSTSDCYSGNCLIETAFNQQYANIKTGNPLNAGSFEIHFRNNGYQGGYGVGVCTDSSAAECASPSAIGGAHALIDQVLTYLNDNAWHYFYFAFEDGSSTKQYCGMVDDNTSSDCVWQNSSVPNGTTYSGVMFFNGNGLNRGASFYWDELAQG